MTAPVMILGSGLAAYNVAREFRKLDKTTPLTIISRDHAGFYSKPMLSNALSGNKSPEQLLMKSAEKMAEELSATILPHSKVLAIHVHNQEVLLGDDVRLPYRDLVLALGADPIRLPMLGDGASDVLSVNDLDDFAHFNRRLANAKTVVILGAGLIGCEFANDLLSRDITPIVIDSASWPLPRLLPQVAGDFLAQKLSAAGVQFHWGVTAKAVDAEGAGFSVKLSNGMTLQADLVLSAVGLRSRTELAAAAGLHISRGVVVDRHLQTSQAHIYAVGDCAEVAGWILPFVMPIMHQAKALAATLAGTTTALKYPAMPVMVKTPACPTVVAPPAIGSVGEWHVETSENGILAKFITDDGAMAGFALLGSATAQRQALTPDLPVVLA
ncbi:NAD(P)/FAD-dependent oxidoreductase [Deefgea rivuli]|uniref:NAD(P)/FAD-dependent oxidoreductase n=1 Tax=Deefgea rivuli TaxID=400948 RepID=UPI00048296BA|nr:FAD-dependent oxidoreductase [Deefgea rivuli]